MAGRLPTLKLKKDDLAPLSSIKPPDAEIHNNKSRKKLDVWQISQVINLLPDGACILDGHGYVIVSNQAFNETIQLKTQHGGRRSILSAVARDDRDRFAEALHLLLRVSDAQIFHIGKCSTCLKAEGDKDAYDFFEWSISWDGISDSVLAYCKRSEHLDTTGISPLKTLMDQTNNPEMFTIREHIDESERVEKKTASGSALSKTDLDSINRLSHELVVQQWSKFSRKINASKVNTPELALAEINFLEFAKEEVTELVRSIAHKGAIELNEFSVLQDRRMAAQAEKLERDVRNESLEKEKRILDKALRDSLEFKKEIIRSISHEIRTPLHVIQSTVLDMENLEEELSGPMREALDRIKTSCLMTSGVLDNLATLGHLEDKTLRIVVKPIDVSALVLDCVADLASYAVDSSIELSHTDVTECCSEHSLRDPGINYILADEVAVRTAIMNTITCALRYSEAGGRVRVSVVYNTKACACEQASLKARRPEDDVRRNCVRVIVQDSGAGLTQEVMTKFLSNTENYSAKDLQKGQGFSLGMKVTQGLLEAHGGKVGVFSEGKDTGSSFYFDFPLFHKPSATTAPNSPRRHNRDSGSSKAAFHEKLRKSPINSNADDKKFVEGSEASIGASDAIRVLIVDDSPLCRKMLTLKLRVKGCECVEVVNGAEAVAKVQQTREMPFDCIFIDNSMPVMNGTTATKLIREDGYKGKIFGITGNALQADVDEFLSLGANNVFLKPLGPSVYETIFHEMQESFGI